ncbi:MAG: hypothetical protein BGN82_10660 [Alphaproteobacteria bacterium 65-7]|nr:MAG: hypothetical protein BGN82_10660 [Alphaproteobacteria bacterium 65-7]
MVQLMGSDMRVLKAVAALLLCAGSAAGCGSLREAAGLAKKSPDEFAVSTKAPLIIPPDFNLRPPSPGAPPANTLDPASNAQAALFNTADPQTVANGMTGNFTGGEKMLLANAGVQNADPGVRTKLNFDRRSLQQADRSFTDRVLGTGATADTGRPVNADAEVNRNSASGRAGGRAAATPKKEKSGGWFDWF